MKIQTEGIELRDMEKQIPTISRSKEGLLIGGFYGISPYSTLQSGTNAVNCKDSCSNANTNANTNALLCRCSCGCQVDPTAVPGTTTTTSVPKIRLY